MKKRNFYVLLLLIFIIITSAAATYSLQMFYYYENNETYGFSAPYNLRPGVRFASLLGTGDFWQAVQAFVNKGMKPLQNLALRVSGGNNSDIAEKNSGTENFIAANPPSSHNRYNIKGWLYYSYKQEYYDFYHPEKIHLDTAFRPVDVGQHKEEKAEKNKEIDSEELEEAVDEDAIGAGADSQFVDKIKFHLEQYPEHFFIRSFNTQRKVALTFDDGPGPHTERILDILTEYNVQATFFVVGFQVEKFPGILSRIVQEGHLVGNHSYSHSDFSELSLTEVNREIEYTNQLIKRETDHKPELVRPPYGRITNQQLENLIKEGYRFINWSVDSLDWDEDYNNHELMLSRIENTIHPGAIILLHDAGGDRSQTEKLLPALIESLRDRGYEFVTVEELLFR